MLAVHLSVPAGRAFETIAVGSAGGPVTIQSGIPGLHHRRRGISDRLGGFGNSRSQIGRTAEGRQQFDCFDHGPIVPHTTGWRR
jgi:hypothetical protein